MKPRLVDGLAFKEPTPRPKRPATTAAERFAEGKVPPTGSRRRKPVGADYERLVFRVPPELAQAVREAALRERRSLSDAATEALGDWVKRRNGAAGT